MSVNIFETKCNAGRETITMHNNGNSDAEFVMELGDWCEVGFTEKELRGLISCATNLLGGIEAKNARRDMKMYSTLCDSKCGSFSSDLQAVKIEASKLAKKYNHAVHIIEVIGQAVPIITIEVNMENEI